MATCIRSAEASGSLRSPLGMPSLALQAARVRKVYAEPTLRPAALRSVALRLTALKPTVEFDAPRRNGVSWFSEPRFQALLDHITQSKAFSSNQARILIDGLESFNRKITSIQQADVIWIETYIWADDNTGRSIVQELLQAASRGAHVFVCFSVLGCFNPLEALLIKIGLKSTIPPVLKPLIGMPRVCVIPNDKPMWDLLRRNHRKHQLTYRHGGLVKVILGGMNISDDWLHGGAVCKKLPYLQYPKKLLGCDTKVKYRDTDVEITGPASENCLYTWLGCAQQEGQPCIKRMPYQGQAKVRFVYNRPEEGDKGQCIKNLYVALLDHIPAGKIVRIANAYFLPYGDVKDALIRAADRGVRIEIVINTTRSPEIESSLVAKVGHSLFRDMLRLTQRPDSFKFYEFFGHPQSGHNVMHHKVASFDKLVMIGSSNMDEQSFRFNQESVVLIEDDTVFAEFDAMWKRDVENNRVDNQGQPIITTRALTACELYSKTVWDRSLEKILRCTLGWYL